MKFYNLDSEEVLIKLKSNKDGLTEEEAKKRFVIDYNLVPDAERGYNSEGEKQSAEVEALQEENKKLKEKLVQLLQLVKKNV